MSECYVTSFCLILQWSYCMSISPFYSQVLNLLSVTCLYIMLAWVGARSKIGGGATNRQRQLCKLCSRYIATYQAKYVTIFKNLSHMMQHNDGGYIDFRR